MMFLPEEYAALISALMLCLATARAGLLTMEREDDPDLLVAALETASRRAGVPIRSEWLGHGRESLVWLREDDVRLKADPGLGILGVTY